MIFNIVVEDLGGAEEGVFVGWLKAAGEHVAQGEAVAEVMTDKVNMEIQASGSGTFEPQPIAEEDPVELGQVIGLIRGEA